MNSVNISVVIPTCNRDSFLHLAIESVLAQTVRFQEIIVVNNGSGKVEIPASFGSEIKTFDIIPFAGVSQARNFGASVATGEVIAFLDDDDLWGECYLENVAEAIESGAECVVSRLDQLVDGKISVAKNAHGHVGLDDLLMNNTGITGSNIAITKTVFFAVGGYDPKLPPSEDKSLAIEVLRKGFEIVTLPDNQAIIRQHNEGSRLSDVEYLPEAYSQFNQKYMHLMNVSQRTINMLKLHRARWQTGRVSSMLPYAYYRVLHKILVLAGV